MREHEEILLGGMFRPSEQNCPTREGELIESLDKIYDIPNPRVGMRVYVENTGKEYIVKSLKEKTIGGVTVPDAMVGTFEETVSEEVLGNVASELANQLSNIEHNIKANALQYNKIGFNVNADRVQLYAKNISDNNVRVDDIPAATTTLAGVMSAEDKKALDAVDNIINIGEYQNIQAVWDACKQVALNNPEISIIKYSVKAGLVYNSGIVFQMYHYNDALVSQYYLYGGGQKHECNVRHIVSDGTTDDWQPIQIFTSYKFENGTLYGYKYGKSESGQNKVAIVDIPNIGAGEYFVPTSGKYDIDGNTYRTIRFGDIPPSGAVININITNSELITLYVPTTPYVISVSVNGNVIEGLSAITSAGVYYIFAHPTGVRISKILPIQ